MLRKRLIALAMIAIMCLSIAGNGTVGVVHATEINDEYNVLDMNNCSVSPKNTQLGDV